MSLSNLPRPSVRPRGGVSKVELVPAPLWAGTGSPFPPGAVEWAFREDRAHYREELTGDEPLVPLVRHVLEMELPLDAASRRAVASLQAANAAGFVAIVTLASGERLTVGRSARFGTLYPLRVAACDLGSGRTPADLPTATLRLESVDASTSENV